MGIISCHLNINISALTVDSDQFSANRKHLRDGTDSTNVLAKSDSPTPSAIDAVHVVVAVSL
ncbi:MAG: hypothetical protein OXF48_03580, partial [Bacteroidetes bacterium]|nr:hypothetical protein [Bacteroidota bacterium]